MKEVREATLDAEDDQHPSLAISRACYCPGPRRTDIDEKMIQRLIALFKEQPLYQELSCP